ncbi:MAG: imidazole glycerol phosphate synthase, glutamine amidotransferase subunit [Spirochaetes bacterium GWF1_31_7]|nr:MAG: imidazole glycerol phosphate synthase, glutamine amidotransferase subunit [Spirochaetes bacterium GWE1_32_154]OHD50071.1 MAG: imidazole glycerol phosphate synthase, glutamine amidotransferase subunit [Spirochaetes bacterium GWE2_31_10]OHD52384.1 MAG: imidazole glycerol phosphate synthase, glutamine amidotransferase subunit [Spirochaetes bacterium GWF1_31_7]OHD81303.1 MAG: imidazole glycerol phosphate synthase, glutamine amidotransferase subunit [Spirochaetes bacterium RIFOXYB1_FULL_32_8]
MIGIIDSKICNIYSLTNMLKKLNADFIIFDNPENIQSVDRIILPGVGAFPKAMENLSKSGLKDAIIQFARSGKPVLGICLGMQLLFDKSTEFGISEGLGLIPGEIIKIKTDLVLPHIGWNDLSIKPGCKILERVDNGADVYFVHSYRAETDTKYIAATTNYGELIPAVVYKDNVYGAQFHPEKSMKWGEIILSNFIKL